jgi:cathepsin B
VALSPLDIVACDFRGENMGCLGGVPLPAWEYAAKEGIVSEACLPYGKPEGGPIDVCDPDPACTLDKHDATPYCTHECAPPRNATAPRIDYASDKRRLGRAYAVRTTLERPTMVEAMQAEILGGGPVEATFAVHQDFLAYKSGVYSKPKGPFMGKHAVAIVGWGRTTGEAEGGFWIARNSWSEKWGDEGLFKIAFGECGIEEEVTSGTW